MIGPVSAPQVGHVVIFSVIVAPLREVVPVTGGRGVRSSSRDGPLLAGMWLLGGSDVFKWRKPRWFSPGLLAENSRADGA